MLPVLLPLAVPSLTITPSALVTDEDKPLTTTLQADVDGARFTLAKPARRGTATLDERTGALTYVAWPDFSGSDRIRVEVTAGGKTFKVDVPITVNAVNDAPVVAPLRLTTKEDTATGGALSVRDAENDKVTFVVGTPPARGTATVDAGGRVTFTPAPDAWGKDRFVVVVDDGASKVDAVVEVDVAAVNDPPVLGAGRIDGVEDTTSSVTLTASDVDGDTLTFEVRKAPKNGAATIDARTGTLTFAPAADWHGDSSVTVRVSDGRASAMVDVPVRIAAVNDPPSARPLRLKTSEDTAVSGVVDVRDVDGDKLSVVVLTPPAAGTATVDAAGAVTFSPAPDAVGAARFVVGADDGTAKSEIEVTVDIAAVNDAPVLRAARIAGPEDAPASVTLVASDVDGDALTFQIKSGAREGTATIDARSGVLTFSPSPDWNGSTALVVLVSDGRAEAVIDVPVVTTPVNDPPAVKSLQLATNEDTTVTGVVDVRDIDGDRVSYALTTPPPSGIASVDAQGKVTYAPAADANGTVRFVVVADDGSVKVEVPVTVEVAAINDAPTVAAVRLDGTEDTAATVQLLGGDVDGDTLTWELKRAPRRGTATVDPASGLLRYVPEPDWNGTVTATIRLTDGRARTDVDVAITIAAVNDAPVVQPLRLTTAEDTATGATVEASDVDRDTLTYVVTTPPALGAAAVDAKGRVTYKPGRDNNGVDRFVVTVSDGTASVPLTVDVQIDPVNDAPVSTTAPLSFAEDTELTATLSATDVDGDRVRFRASTAPNGGGRFSLSSTGELRWAPPANYNGRDKIGFELDDGTVRTAVTLAVTVTPANDAPTLRVLNAVTREDTPTVTEAAAADIDGDKLTLRIAKQGEKATATVDQRGSVRVTPLRDVWGKDTIVVAVDDGTTTTTESFVVTIEPQPDPPVVRDERLTTSEDTPAEASLPGTDPDGDRLTFKLTSTGTLGTATLLDARTGRVSYAPRKDVFGDDVVGFEVTDGVDDRRHRVSGRLLVTTRPVDDAPIAADVELATDEDTPVRGAVAMTDVDGDALALTIVTQPEAGGTARVEDAARGAFVFEPARDFNGDVSVFVAAAETASDKLVSAPATVRVKVKAVNDAPAARALGLKTDEDTGVDGTIVASDVDRDPLRFTLTKPPQTGTVTLDAQTGRLTYAPRRNTHGNDSFVVTIDDGAGGSASARVDVAVAPVDDAPAAIPGDLMSPRNGRAAGKLLGRDPEGDALSFRIVEPPPVGSIKLLSETTGEFAFTIQGGTKGTTAPFRFVVVAGGKTSEPATVVIRIE